MKVDIEELCREMFVSGFMLSSPENNAEEPFLFDRDQVYNETAEEAERAYHAAVKKLQGGSD